MSEECEPTGHWAESGPDEHLIRSFETAPTILLKTRFCPQAPLILRVQQTIMCCTITYP